MWTRYFKLLQVFAPLVLARAPEAVAQAAGSRDPVTVIVYDRRALSEVESTHRLVVIVRDAGRPERRPEVAAVFLTPLDDRLEPVLLSPVSAAWQAADKDSIFVIQKPDSGSYEVTVRALGYDRLRFRVHLAIGCRQTLEVYLARARSELYPSDGLPVLPKILGRATFATCGPPV